MKFKSARNGMPQQVAIPKPAPIPAGVDVRAVPEPQPIAIEQPVSRVEQSQRRAKKYIDWFNIYYCIDYSLQLLHEFILLNKPVQKE